MDRLSTLMFAVALIGCGNKADTPATPMPSRTDGAKVAAPKAASTEAFCDLHATDAKAAAFHWPELAAGGSPPGAPGDGKAWRWVNVWATWCEPCIEEMPRLVAWRDKLAAAGKPVELAFLSVDDDDGEVAAFHKAHPEAPPSVRISTADQRTAWLKSFGLGDGAIPIQLFVSPSGKLRCARAGGILEKDYAVVSQVLSE